VLSIGARIADALHYSHRRGVVHGDIKPANIIFDATTGRVALTDFPSDSRAICTIGTQAYMAPECLRGEIASPASDQFSLAVTLYQLLCGRHPFAGRSSPEIVRRMTAEPHTDIRVYTPSLPPTLVKLFDTALAKQPHRRYPDLTAMKKAISRIRAHMNTRACVESTERYNAHLSAL
jgi:serine/threonine-protein kinase